MRSACAFDCARIGVLKMPVTITHRDLLLTFVQKQLKLVKGDLLEARVLREAEEGLRALNYDRSNRYSLQEARQPIRMVQSHSPSESFVCRRWGSWTSLLK